MVNIKVKEEQYGASVTICDYILAHQIKEINPHTIVDFGAGNGKNSKIARNVTGKNCRMIAVEGFHKTAKMLLTKNYYDEVHNDLLQNWIAKDTHHYELAIFGDVLEHLKPNQIYSVIKKSIKKFDHLIIITPLHDLYQGVLYSNNLEIHRTYITCDYFDRFFPIEKHIVFGKTRTVMNIYINSKLAKRTFKYQLARWIFHHTILLLQPIGLAPSFTHIFSKYFNRHMWIFKG